MHKTAVRAGLDVLKPQELRRLPAGHEDETEEYEQVSGLVTSVERMRVAQDLTVIWVEVEGHDGKFILPSEVETEPIA